MNKTNTTTLILIFSCLIAITTQAFTTEQEATTFINEVTNKNNIYHYKTLSVEQKLNTQEINVHWVVEIHSPSVQTNQLDEQGKPTIVTIHGKEIASVSGSTTVHTTESLTAQKTRIEGEAITQAKNWKPNPTIKFETHNLKYSKELR